MKLKNLRSHQWFSVPICLLILSLAFLTGFEPVLHNHDLNETQQDCASCTWSHSKVSEPLPDFEQALFFDNQSIVHVPTSNLFCITSSPYSSRAPPLSAS
ncbi:MAG: hypothetical protein COV66_15290 [Nitrospinae bacterium CG11_big_fil_rev_8_21_14_0_20_45_15]|nr:MAG: hypothetical protein COV66_15290 [Nitrospinae bacterium CG11_big_fil_rev_8_21_14_0_20_45_15]